MQGGEPNCLTEDFGRGAREANILKRDLKWDCIHVVVYKLIIVYFLI